MSDVEMSQSRTTPSHRPHLAGQDASLGVVNVVARLIEDGIGNLPTYLVLRPADVLVVRATCAHVQSGDAVEMLGPFVHGVVDTMGRVRSPAGAPNAVLFIARRIGTSRIDIVIGDPWRTTNLHVVDVEVIP